MLRSIIQARMPYFFALLCAMLLAANAHSAEPAPDKQTARYEITFMQDMIDHHAMAVETSSTCQEKAVHPELIELCAQIEQAQRQEIATMQAWLENWYGVSYEPEMSNGEQRTMERLASLSGEAYEIAFMQMMIDHHSAAIEEGNECLQQAYHASLLELCENIVVSQSMEIRQMRTWLCEWYGRCDARDRR
jgi:uncharacterized protein (DUF305 family)